MNINGRDHRHFLNSCGTLTHSLKKLAPPQQQRSIEEFFYVLASSNKVWNGQTCQENNLIPTLKHLPNFFLVGIQKKRRKGSLAENNELIMSFKWSCKRHLQSISMKVSPPLYSLKERQKKWDLTFSIHPFHCLCPKDRDGRSNGCA